MVIEIENNNGEIIATGDIQTEELSNVIEYNGDLYCRGEDVRGRGTRFIPVRNVDGEVTSA